MKRLVMERLDADDVLIFTSYIDKTPVYVLRNQVKAWWSDERSSVIYIGGGEAGKLKVRDQISTIYCKMVQFHH